MLTFESSPAPAPGSRILVLLHGRGADERDLLPLGRELPAGWSLVAPRAPFPGAPWGYGGGWAWYRFLGDRAPDPDSLSGSFDAVGELLDALPAELGFVPPEIVVGGFSQGGTTALGFALANPGRVRRVVVLSGFLPVHPLVQAAPATAGALRIFWGHGRADPAIPFTWGEAGRAELRGLGAEVTARDYPIGHGISRSELEDLARWLDDSPAS